MHLPPQKDELDGMGIPYAVQHVSNVVNSRELGMLAPIKDKPELRDRHWPTGCEGLFVVRVEIKDQTKASSRDPFEFSDDKARDKAALTFLEKYLKGKDGSWKKSWTNISVHDVPDVEIPDRLLH